MNPALMKTTHKCDLCVIGGGLAGLCAALSAARHGVSVILIGDRPMLGGNSSSEIRMWVRGAGSVFREPGIIAELDLLNIYHNPHMNWHIWDTVLYDAARHEENLKLILNCSVCDAAAEGGRVMSVTGWQTTTYTWHTVEAKIFADCSGDSILAPLIGAEYRVGREGRAEFGEAMAGEVGDKKHMGMSCLIQARQTDHPVKFIPPEWAERFPDESKLEGKKHDCVNSRINFWWLEVGGDTADGISDTEECRDRLLALAMGIWDHIKNTGDHGAENWELEWVGFLPGKRESRRYVGAYTLTGNDLASGGDFPDAVAYGGWTMDNHDPRGVDAEGYSSCHTPVHVPYLIPFRSLYSKDFDNLMFAGRNISATHMALSSTRVMATCAMMGQAVGAASALCIERDITPDILCKRDITALQDMLCDDGIWLPGHKRPLHSLMSGAKWSRDGDILADGIERQLDGVGHYTTIDSPLTLTLAAPLSEERTLRLAFDPDWSRESINRGGENNPFSQKSHRRLDFKPLNMPDNLVKSLEVRFTLSDGGEETRKFDNLHTQIFKLTLPIGVSSVTIRGRAWNGEARIFSFDII